jgi:hypothetical protein
MKKRILLIDIGPTVCETPRTRLARQHHEAGRTSDGKDALLVHRDKSPPRAAEPNLCPAAYSGWGINE